MELQRDRPRGFVKHVVRQAIVVARTTTTATSSASQGAKTSTAIERAQTSSLKAPTVAILLGVFIGVFILFVLIGITCKFANRPSNDSRPQHYAKTMYQPSAAGYGSKTAGQGGGSYRPNDSMHDVSNLKAGLLDSAQPMGRGGRYEEADDSLGSSNGIGNGNTPHAPNGGFGMISSNSASSFSGSDSHRFGPSRGGHARGASSGVELPGPAASATFRRNVSGSHPPIHSPNDESYDSPNSANGLVSASIMPDGSGFRPGQIFDHATGAPKASAEMRDHGNSYFGAPPAGLLPRGGSLVQHNSQQRPYARGPPPASSKNRRSRYGQGALSSSADTAASRRSRIDSIGPGTYRKSMFLPPDQEAMPKDGFVGGSQVRRTTTDQSDVSAKLRRVESIGKGDPRRSSRYNPNQRSSRIPTMMVPEEDYPSTSAIGHWDGLPSVSDGLLSGNQGGWDSGRRSPYVTSSNGSNCPLGPLGPNDLSVQQQQQQQDLIGGGVRMMAYGAGFGNPMPRPGMAITSISTPSSFAQAAPLGAGLGRGTEASNHAASRQIV
ncbi:uncharacterized protein MEPE_06004 [Melanopsichium pennsylvanicum]|uniref:Uncharacterized protein n=2 Tax=Melanopsichium pennsylvanicum TaxID=63383 RepID=A0AAJ4XQH1_9BASI|nr:putative protein [Melanopsichium pennsylvanicum 4]SNX87294.1 uncharacterized protein MEPE_06004 [Melanopsichium pennsylvanicum]